MANWGAEAGSRVCALLCPQHHSLPFALHPAAPWSLSCHCAAPAAQGQHSSAGRAARLRECSSAPFPVPLELPLLHQHSWLQCRLSCRGCSECPQRDPSPGWLPDGDGGLAGAQSQSLTPVLATLCTLSCPAASREHHGLCCSISSLLIPEGICFY